MNHWICVYCGLERPGRNGTGSDVSCCGEVGHVEAAPDFNQKVNLHADTIAERFDSEKEKG